MIPIDEQPYPLPDSWQWTRQKNICDLSQGEKLSDKMFPYLDVKYLRGTKEKFFVDNGNYIEAGTKIILVDGENSGEIFTAPEAGYMGSTFLVVNISERVNADFFQYFASTKKDFYKKNKRGSAIPHLNKNLFYLMPFPLPPLDEQQRIVAVLDELFADLDEAKALAQAVVDGSKLRRATILHKAFTGELSKLWRNEHGSTLDGWQRCLLSEVLLPMQTKRPAGKIFRYIDIDSIDNKRQTVREPKIIETAEAPSRASRAVESGNVLFSMVRPYLKNVALIDESLSDCIASTGFFVCRCTKKILSKFLYQFLCFDGTINYLTQFMKGDNSPAIRRNEFLSTPINLPTLEEQKEIVRLLDDLLGREQRTKDLALKMLERVELMKKSILARAFRGELVTNKNLREI